MSLGPILLGGCAEGLAGEVRDGSSSQPVADAEVALLYRGWGKADGRLVWDADKRETVRSGSDGSFRFGRASGLGLRIRARGYPDVRAAVCPEGAPVYIGGPFSRAAADRVVLAPLRPTAVEGVTAADVGAHAFAADLGFSIAAPDWPDGRILTVAALPGYDLTLVPGTGTIPRPPASGWRQAFEFDPTSACAWLFIRRGVQVDTAIAIGTVGTHPLPSGHTALTLLYASLTP